MSCKIFNLFSTNVVTTAAGKPSEHVALTCWRNRLGRFDMDVACFANILSVHHANIIEHVQKCWEPSPTFSLFLDVGTTV